MNNKKQVVKQNTDEFKYEGDTRTSDVEEIENKTEGDDDDDDNYDDDGDAEIDDDDDDDNSDNDDDDGDSGDDDGNIIDGVTANGDVMFFET